MVPLNGDPLNETSIEFDDDLLARQIARAKRRIELTGSDEYSTDGEVYKLWSDGEGDIIFENTHGCWDYIKILNQNGLQLSAHQ